MENEKFDELMKSVQEMDMIVKGIFLDEAGDIITPKITVVQPPV